jgi:hypothetical protein
MKRTLIKLGLAVGLTLTLALSAFAGEPPCGTPDPGQIPTPPCATQFADGGMDMPLGHSNTASNMGTPTVANDETSFNEIAAKVVLGLLPLF